MSRGEAPASRAALCAMVWLVVGAGGSQMEHFTPEWEERYNHDLLMSHPDCVGCNAIVPFAEFGREKSCISHCELVVPPDATALDCEAKCWKLRLAKAWTDQPCMALGLCPAPLVSSVSPKARRDDAEEVRTRPIVLVSGSEASRAFEGLVSRWIAISIPDAYVRRVLLTDYSLDDDASVQREYAYYRFRPLHAQVERLCAVLELDPALEDGFDMVAFGQGGLLARGYVQQCNHPQVHTLITYNTPHAGCASDALRSELRALERLGGGFGPAGGESGPAGSEYSELVQSTSAAAGYFRDPARHQEYLANSSFLPDLNLERTAHAKGAAVEGASEARDERGEMVKLKKLVLVKGSKDRVLKPETSAWFETYAPGGAAGAFDVPKLMDTSIYSRLGLSDLDADGRLDLVSFEFCEWNVKNRSADDWDECRREVTQHITLHLGGALKSTVNHS